jgi:thiol-disulfide isomerase/thioredoxin
MRTRGLAGAAAMIVALGACSGAPPATAPAPPAPAQAPHVYRSAAAADVAPGHVADLTWTATTISGQPFDAASLKGRPAVLWFWAPWCPICSSQIGTVKKLVGTYGKRVTVVGVGGLSTSGSARDGEEVLPGVTTLDDTLYGDVWQRFAVEEQATFIVIDSTGKITYNSTSDPENWTKVTSKVAAVVT